MGDIIQQSILREVLESNYSITEKLLYQHARKALAHSYAPYSQFPVGCVALLKDDTLVYGANQENAAYPSGLCAERVALFAAKAQNPNLAITHIAIAINAEYEQIPFPCGACLQVMAEVENRQSHSLQIYLVTQNKMYCAKGVKNLLPFAFEKAHLKS